MSLARVLAVGGSDGSGGAGIEADIKTIQALGGYGMTAITAVTAQNSEGVRAIERMPAHFVRLSMAMTLGDIGADAIKLGMLGDAELVGAVAEILLGEAAGVQVILDPVMVSTSGAMLLPADGVAALRRRLIPRASLVTPNLLEAEALVGFAVRTPGEMKAAGEAIRAMGAAAVLIKGGHGQGKVLSDVLVSAAGVEEFFLPRIETRHTHGTGCTLASAIATGLGQGMGLVDAVRRARYYVQDAIANGPGFGRGHGPIGHGHRLGAYV